MDQPHAPTLYLICGKIAAAHELHLLDVPDSICKQRLRERNAGGAHPFQVSEAEYDQFTSYFAPPGPEEAFNTVVHAP
jgi:AAA domain-containing protein